jgi:hypothetical protein
VISQSDIRIALIGDIYFGDSILVLSSFLLGQYLFDEGADVVAGHHSYIVHDSKKIRDNTYLAYSLGNIYFALFTRANKEEIVFHVKEIYGAILILVFAPDGVTLYHQWRVTKQVGNRILSDNTKKRYKMYSSQSAFISKTGLQYVQALRNRETKELVFSLVHMIFRPVKSLLSTIKRF